MVTAEAPCIDRLGRTCLQREHAVSVCATRDELSSAALSLALPLAGPPAGACIPPILVPTRRWLSLVQGAYCVRSAPHATDHARPRLSVVSHRRQIRFSSCKQRIHFSAVVLAGRRSRPGKNTCRVPSLNRLLSSVLLRLRGTLPVCITTCQYCFVRSRARSCSRLIASKYASKFIILSSAM